MSVNIEMDATNRLSQLPKIEGEPDSALYVACAALHAASARLLLRAQAEGTARIDMTGDDLFGLMSALGWLVDLPSFAPRAGHLVHIVASAILKDELGDEVENQRARSGPDNAR